MTEPELVTSSAREMKPLDSKFIDMIKNLFKFGKAKFVREKMIFEDGAEIPIVNGIPRFVPDDRYTGSFSYQWSNYTDTQLDSIQGSNLSQQDLINKTNLRPEDVKGKLILDAGVGIGRHSEVLSEWGAYVVGIDMSSAVEAAKKNLSSFSNAYVIQADIGDLPFREKVFDHIISIGVLHHTPNTKHYTEQLVKYLKPNGWLSVWVYPPKFARRGEWTPLTSRLPIIAFRGWCEWMSDISRENKGNRLLEAFINQFPFSTHHETCERTVLAMFDGYTPHFHWTHTADEVMNWFIQWGMLDVRKNSIDTSVSGRKPN